VRSEEDGRSCKCKIGEQGGDVIPIRVLPVKTLGRGLQVRSGKNNCEGGVIRTGWREGVVPGGEILEQSSIGEGQVESYRAMIRGEQVPSVNPGCIEERKQLRRCSVKIRRTNKLIVVEKQASRVGSGVMNVEVPKNKSRKIMLGK